MSNANRDYAIVYDVKNSSLALSRPLVFYITDKNTSNIFVRLVTKIIIGDGIDQYTDIENATNYTLTMRVIKPNDEIKSVQATQHEPESLFQFDLTEDFKDMPGKYICELIISTIVNGRQELITSDAFNYEVKRSILSKVNVIEGEGTTVEKLLNDLDATKAELSSQIKNKANKNEVFSMANMGQDIKEAMTGGSVAVVGKDTILTENIVDGQVTYSKTDFLELDSSKQCYRGEILRNMLLNQGSSTNTTTKFVERENSLIAIVKIKPNTTYSILKEESSITSTQNVWTYTFSQDKITEVNKYSGNPRNTVNGTYTEITSGDDHNYLYINYTATNENCYIQVAEGTNKNLFYAKGDYNVIIPKNISIYNKFEVDEKINNLSLEVDVFQKVLFNKFLCIGDSITKGYRNSDYTDKTKSYPVFLSKLSGWECVNAGEAGFTSINWFNLWSDKYIEEGYDGYIIKLGQNGGLTDTIDTDCVGSSYLDYAETNTGCYCKIIERIMERTPKAKIFLVSIRSSATDTNDVIRKIAAKYNLPFIDLSKYPENLDASKFHVSASGSSYNVHFNTIGYTYLADAIYKGILKSIHEREDEYIDF